MLMKVTAWPSKVSHDTKSSSSCHLTDPGLRRSFNNGLHESVLLQYQMSFIKAGMTIIESVQCFLSHSATNTAVYCTI